MFALESKALDFGILHLNASKMLYASNLIISKNVHGLHAKGDIRFGPLKTNVEIQTELTNGETFNSYRIQAPTLKYWQKYQLIDGRLYYTRSKDNTERTIDISETEWWDPLSLLIQVRSDYMANSLREVYHTFSKNKFSPLTTDRRSGYCQLLKNQKPLVSIAAQGPKDFKIRIDKLGAELLLESR